MGSGLYLKLPATSANLGPGFDTLALALDLHLEIRAREASEFSIAATGRSPEVCGALGRNLLLDVYRKTMALKGLEAKPLELEVNNGIPLGMGCGSSAAVRLAGVSLAAHFGGMGWSRAEILAEATRLEGHPDNAAACWLGGFVAGSWDGETLHAVSFPPPAEWRALIVLPETPLSTAASRAALPENYSRADVVANLQRVAVLTGAFATGRGSLIADAMKDRIHQPYRSEACPLLPKLLPMAGKDGILGVSLSGAGPAVLALVESEVRVEGAKASIIKALEENERVEILTCRLEREGAENQSY
jgi:homoserine kinase